MVSNSSSSCDMRFLVSLLPVYGLLFVRRAKIDGCAKCVLVILLGRDNPLRGVEACTQKTGPKLMCRFMSLIIIYIDIRLKDGDHDGALGGGEECEVERRLRCR